MQRISLLKLAHEIIGDALRPGDIAVDATVGNGHDTAFLADCVGPSGRLYGFDSQQQALAATLAKLDMRTGVALIHASHADMSANIPAQFHGKIRACMFNLGYLPGGDKRLVTHVDSTLAALTCAAGILATGGILTVIAYPGHPGGEQETAQVKHWCGQLDAAQFNVKTVYSDKGNAAAPRLFVICKTGGAA